MKRLGFVVGVFLCFVLGACASTTTSTVVAPSESGPAVVQPLTKADVSVVVTAADKGEKEVSDLLKQEIESQLKINEFNVVSDAANQTIAVVMEVERPTAVAKVLVWPLPCPDRVNLKVKVTSSGKTISDFGYDTTCKDPMTGDNVKITISQIAKNIVGLLMNNK